MLARISSKGQLVIPKSVRQALELRTGDQFDIQVRQGEIVLRPIGPSAIDVLYGKYAHADLLADLEAEHQQEIRHDEALCS